MSDASINQGESSYTFHLGLLLTLVIVTAWYITQGRDGAIDIWTAATVVFVAWALRQNRSKFHSAREFDSNAAIIGIEHAVIGKQRHYWHDEQTGIRITWLITLACLLYSIVHFFDSQHLAISEGSSDLESWIYGSISSLTTAFFYWTIALIVIKVPRWDNLVSDPRTYLAPPIPGGTNNEAALAFKANSGFIVGFVLGYVAGGLPSALALGLVAQGIVRLPITSTLGAFSALIILQLLGWLSYFALVEVEWDVIWANRVLVLVGQLMTESMTQDYFPSQNWRIWIMIYMVWAIVGGIYGTLAEKPRNFIIPFGIFSLTLVLIANNQTFINYDSDGTLWRLMFATILAMVSFLLANRYSVSVEEFQANRLRSYFMAASVLVFFSIFIIMDPPESIQKLACEEIDYEYELIEILDSEGITTGNFTNGSDPFLSSGSWYAKTGGTLWIWDDTQWLQHRQLSIDDWECGLAHFQGPEGNDPVPILGKLTEGFSEPGLKPSQWGGLFTNLIVAAAGCVLGFFVGIALAFGRQSNLPFFKVPSVLFIELIRSGPLICWLYFAMYLLPDVVDPTFQNPDDFDNIVRMMMIFALFGGCYIAEVLRGGLQAVDSGQKEAAVALGLNPIQTKTLIELPNAIRTTLPSIVSVFIGLWKDTTLLLLINILDFFLLAKNAPNTDLRFLGDFVQPIYVSAIVFWAVAFYLSRISLRIERNMGLVKEGGGEMA
tara:strand:+ start:2947 stop:5103 length:2157 start_codon:yes stop_codon:yes gene_type:complete